jgi:hypothetical protein
MPLNVPTEQDVQQGTLSLPRAQQLGDEGLGTIAQGAGVAADAMRASQIDLVRKRNAALVIENDTAIDDLYRQQRQSAMQQRGSAAHEVTKRISDWWESEPAKLMANLENSTQRELFSESVRRRRSASLDEFSNFEAQETTRGAVQASQSGLENAIDMGAASYSNPASLELAREEITKNLSVLSAMQSWTEADYSNARTGAFTKLHTNVIENMIDDDPAAASEYFSTHKGEIAGSVHDAITSKLKSGADIRVAQNAADDIWNRGLNETAALAAARKELEGTAREQAVSLLRQQYSEQKAGVAQFRKARLDSARSAFDEGGIRALTPGMIEVLREDSPGELRMMRESKPQDQVPTNWDVYDGLTRMAREQRTEFADDVDLQMHVADLNSRELSELQKLQSDIREGRASPTATLTQMLGEVEWGDREQKGQFDRAVREAILVEQSSTGTPPDQFRMREIINDQLTQVVIPRWFWFDREVPRFEATAEEFEAIPQADRDEVSVDFRKERGRAPTNAEVVRTYNRWAVAQQQQTGEE